jgi:transposase-like protein
MASARDLSDFWCWHKDCPDYGKKGSRNIVLKEFYGKNNTALLKCRTCGHCFSETRGTPFFGLTTPWEEVVRTLAQIPEKGSIRGVARSSGHDKSTICKWVDLAGKHCEEVTDYFLQDLCLDRVQVDEIWSYIKKAKEYHRRRS